MSIHVNSKYPISSQVSIGTFSRSTSFVNDIEEGDKIVRWNRNIDSFECYNKFSDTWEELDIHIRIMLDSQVMNDITTASNIKQISLNYSALSNLVENFPIIASAVENVETAIKELEVAVKLCTDNENSNANGDQGACAAV